MKRNHLMMHLGILILALIVAVDSVTAAENKMVRITEEDVQKAMALKKREDFVAAKEVELDELGKELAAVKIEVDEKLTRLVKLQKEVKGQLEELKSAQTSEFKSLIKVYSAMSASKVAPLLDKMDEPSVVKILRAMKTDNVAKIMAKLDQKMAISVTKRLGMLDRSDL